MITLDNKMELFSKVVLDKVKKEYIETMHKMDLKHEEMKKEKMIELEKQSVKYSREMNQRAINERKKIISKAKGQARKNILVKKEELFLELKNHIIVEIKKYCMSKEYNDFIVTKVNENIIELLSLGDKLIVLCRKIDKEIVEAALLENTIGNEIKFIFDDNILGGFTIIDKLKGVKINLTIDSVLEENNVYIGSLIHSLLEEAGDIDE